MNIHIGSFIYLKRDYSNAGYRCVGMLRTRNITEVNQ
jgi:hypothetical protein